MAVTVRVSGIERTRGRLARLQRKLANLDWLWLNVIELFVNKERLWFASRGQGGWPPLSPTYAAWKAIHFPGQPLMVRTGDLRDDLTKPERAVLARTDRQLFLGTSLVYASFHATGTGTMPARPPIIPADSLLAGIALRIHYELTTGLG